MQALGFAIPPWAWAVITAVGVGWFVGVWASDGFKFRLRRKEDFSDFDMRIEGAIQHIVDSTHHSFIRSSLAERNAFEQFHTAMCSGHLDVIGREGGATKPRKISRRRCKKLDRIEVATAHGIRFQLAEKKVLDEIATGIKAVSEGSSSRFEHKGPRGFSELRVRAKDVFGIWPKDMEGGE